MNTVYMLLDHIWITLGFLFLFVYFMWFHVRNFFKKKFTIKYLIFLTIFAAIGMQTLIAWSNILDIYLERGMAEATLAALVVEEDVARNEEMKTLLSEFHEKEKQLRELSAASKNAERLFESQLAKLATHLEETAMRQKESTVLKAPIPLQSTLHNFNDHCFRIYVADGKKVNLVVYCFDVETRQRIDAAHDKSDAMNSTSIVQRFKTGLPRDTIEKVFNEDGEFVMPLAPGQSLVTISAIESRQDDPDDADESTSEEPKSEKPIGKEAESEQRYDDEHFACTIQSELSTQVFHFRIGQKMGRLMLDSDLEFASSLTESHALSNRPDGMLIAEAYSRNTEWRNRIELHFEVKEVKDE